MSTRRRRGLGRRVGRWVGTTAGVGVGSAWMDSAVAVDDGFVWLGATLGADVGSGRIRRVDRRKGGTLGVAGLGVTLGTAGVVFGRVGAVCILD